MFKSLSRIVSAVLLFGAVSAAPAVAADLQDIIASGKVRIGVPVDVPPFGSVDANNEPVGLDVDMAKMIAEALGVELELQQITGANRVPYLATDRLDIVIAAMGATPERALSIAFTSPYAALSSGVFGPDSIAVTSVDDLGTTSVAVARGTTQDLLLTERGAERQHPALRRRRDRRRRVPFRPGTASRHRRRGGQGPDGEEPGLRTQGQVHPASSRPATSASSRATPSCCAGSIPSCTSTCATARFPASRRSGSAPRCPRRSRASDLIRTRQGQSSPLPRPRRTPSNRKNIMARTSTATTTIDFDRAGRQIGFVEHSAFAARGCLGRHAHPDCGDQERLGADRHPAGGQSWRRIRGPDRAGRDDPRARSGQRQRPHHLPAGAQPARRARRAPHLAGRRAQPQSYLSGRPHRHHHPADLRLCERRDPAAGRRLSSTCIPAAPR